MNKIKLTKKKYFIEYIFVKSLYLILENVSIETASNIGAALGRIAYLLSHKSKKIARTNLQVAFPELSDKETNIIIKKMWDNLCRSLCETPSVYKLSDSEIKNRVTSTYSKNFKKIQKDQSVIAITGHFGNWNITARIFKQHKENISVIYRVANNPKTDKLYLSNRVPGFNNIPKGTMALRKVFEAIKNKDAICFLADQKLNTGIPVKFFGKTSMTTAAPMKLALKFDLPIFFVHTSRIKGTRFKTHIDGPYSTKDLLKNKENASDKELALTQIMNEKIENWIRKDPSQWLWIHRRCEKSFYE